MGDSSKANIVPKNARFFGGIGMVMRGDAMDEEAANKKALAEQEKAQKRANAAIALSKKGAVSYSAFLAQQSKTPSGGTMLTGSQGVDNAMLPTQKATLLGES